MPFGLCNAPATFQKLTDYVLAGLHGQSCLVYLDDIIILGRFFSEHLHNLRDVFDRFQEAGLKLKPSKCTLGQKEVAFFGHIVSDKGDPRSKIQVEDGTETVIAYASRVLSKAERVTVLPEGSC